MKMKALACSRCENCKEERYSPSSVWDWYLMVVYTVTSHISYGLLGDWQRDRGLTKVYVHCFLDGRDTPPASGKDYVEQLEAKMKEIGVGEDCNVFPDVTMQWTVTTAGIV